MASGASRDTSAGVVPEGTELTLEPASGVPYRSMASSMVICGAPRPRWPTRYRGLAITTLFIWGRGTLSRLSGGGRLVGLSVTELVCAMVLSGHSLSSCLFAAGPNHGTSAWSSWNFNVHG